MRVKPSSGNERPVVLIVILDPLTLLTVNSRPLMWEAGTASAAANSPAMRIFSLIEMLLGADAKLIVMVFCVASKDTVLPVVFT